MQFLYAFLIGGALCAIAQILIDKTNMTPARILITYICLGALLTIVGVYDPLIKLAGCGATLPISGFGNLLANGAMDAVDKDGFMGILSGGLSAVAIGVSFTLLCGLIAALFFNSKEEEN
ncbi:MAG: stage V sporulation protein AE [Clostridiales bacterium]|jgi:stage V sporulation protein AE|nr:stage V sporulation protein AE [Clostridiales bacterium]